MTLETRIDSVGQRIRRLAQRLDELGFEFERPDEVFPGPEPDAVEGIARIEREAGALPLALKLFWLRVGSVDFCGSHSEWEVQPGAGWDDYADPLVVFPVSFAVQDLEEFLEDKDERLRHDFPYAVPIAPDSKHKANVSGGACYSISVPAVADDPLLNDEWHNTTFVSYLELAVQCAGFPGLSRCAGHSWPIAELVRDL